MFNKKNKFTLIELIIVIAILGILSVIIIPNVKDIKTKAEVASVKSNIRNIQTAVDMFYMDYGNYPCDNQPKFEKESSKSDLNMKNMIVTKEPINFSKDNFVTDYLREIPKDTNIYYVDAWGTVSIDSLEGEILPPKNNIPTLIKSNSHTLYLTNEGNVYSWGSNHKGALGLGTEGTYSNQTFPHRIKELTNIKQIDVGVYSSIALTEDGNLYVWGDTTEGKLGLKNNPNHLIPQKIESIANVTEVSMGDSHSLALTETGEVYAWGNNDFGCIFGGKNNEPYYSEPIKLDLPEKMESVYAGETRSFAITKTGEVYAWGNNGLGSLGIGSNGSSYQVNKIETLSPYKIVKVVDGNSHSLFLTDNGDVWASGYNAQGQLGLGEYNPNSINLPRKVPSLSYIVDIAASTCSSSAVSQTGEVYTWGKDLFGSQGQNYAPKKVILGDSVAVDDIELSGSNSFMITSDNEIYSTGEESNMGMGNSGRFNLPPTKITPDLSKNDISYDGIVDISSGGVHSMYLNNKGEVYTWGSNVAGELGLGIKGEYAKQSFPLKNKYLKNIVKIDSGFKFSGALDSNGNLYMWGDNSYGQLGIKSPVNTTIPQIVDSLTDIKGFSVGYSHSLLVTNSGEVYGWGKNDYSCIKRGNASYNQPEKIDIPEKIKQVYAGYNRSFAITEDGQVYAWGKNGLGELGVGSTGTKYTPIKIETLSTYDIIQIVDGDNHSFFLTKDGTVWATGYNAHGQLGLGRAVSQTAVPVRVESLMFINEVSAYGDSSIAISKDGEVHTWGSNLYYHLGLGHKDNVFTPTKVNILGNFSSIHMGQYHSFVFSKNELYGVGSRHQLGIGYEDGITINEYIKIK